MKILFLVYHGFDDASGITKKIFAQVKGLRQNGHQVHICYYDVRPDGHRCRFVDEEVIADYGCGTWAAVIQRIDYRCLYRYCITHHIELVYSRSYMNATPPLVWLFKKLRKAGVRSVMEIPTYPYDHEFDGYDWDQRMRLRIDQMFRRRLSAQMDAIVTFSDEDRIFGQRTIRISNGVDFDAIPLHQSTPQPQGEIHIIAVAEVHTWHGFDRFIHGMGEYYEKSKMEVGSVKPRVFFHIVGDVWNPEMNGSSRAPGFRTYIEQYGLQPYVIFHGKLFGDELTKIFNLCCFAVGSLARHRSGITVIKTLKNREYACRGIPFIYSEQDSDFDHQPYVLKAPADESSIDIQHVIDFVTTHQFRPETIRQTVEHLSWQRQMAIVVNAIQE